MSTVIGKQNTKLGKILTANLDYIKGQTDNWTLLIYNFTEPEFLDFKAVLFTINKINPSFKE